MGINAFIDIAIGLVLMYLVLSIVCTSVNEALATLANIRAKTLRGSLEHIVDNTTLRGTFYGHGLISGPGDATGRHPSYVSGKTFALALLDSLNVNTPLPGFSAITAAAAALPPSNVRDMLMANIATAGGNLDKLRDNVATSFDQSMERVSGIYKRYLKWSSLLVGLLVAGALNADSINVARKLWVDSDLRTHWAASATTILAAAKEDLAKAEAAKGGATPTVGDLLKQVQKADDTLRPLPLGWDRSELQGFNAWSWLVKTAGLMMTAIALMLGAPFWFDLLSKFMNIRGTGTKPQQGT